MSDNTCSLELNPVLFNAPIALGIYFESKSCLIESSNLDTQKNYIEKVSSPLEVKSNKVNRVQNWLDGSRGKSDHLESGNFDGLDKQISQAKKLVSGDNRYAVSQDASSYSVVTHDIPEFVSCI